MRYGLGVDLGISFSAAAVAAPSGVRTVFLPPNVVVPSVAYLDDESTLVTGVEAEKGEDPKRLARGFKRKLGEPSPLILGGHPYSAAALMAAQLRDIMAEVTRVHDRPPAAVVLTHPATWNAYRREQFTEVPRLAGISNFQLVSEPTAVAAHYCKQNPFDEGDVIAVYDLGGETFDITILRLRADRADVLGTPEAIDDLGGDAFDELLLAEIDNRVDGAISRLDTKDPEQAALRGRIRELAVKAKEDLSIEPDVTVSVPLPDSPEVSISRLEFNDLIKPRLTSTIDAVRRALSSARLAPKDLKAIVLSGGSARIPLVAQLLSQEFGRPVRTSAHPKHTVALGAAHITERLRTEPPKRPAKRTVVTPPPRPTPRHSPPPKPTAPPTPPESSGPEKRRRWIPVTIAGAVAAVVALVLALVLVPTPAPLVRPTTTLMHEPLFDEGELIPPWRAYVGSPVDRWAGVEIDDDGAQTETITGRIDHGHLDVIWTGEGQVYLQSGRKKDLQSYFRDDKSALVFNVAVFKPPKGNVSLQVQCDHPCYASVEIDGLLKRLPVGQRITVAVPLHCIAEHPGNLWQPESVDTPWLLYSEDALAASFTRIYWTADASDLNPVPCDRLDSATATSRPG
ncbi:Hsp70 family protein [Thermocrispum municipale]|uniref:Hsp70 family protein n=1 Tax=Thermocrispum municipale TaxID=37926 RepID=UPI0004141B76|nr:Hsp70 family protein [Thermocrispum municipale]